MITFEQAMKVHARLITDFGGSTGIRDKQGLFAALGRPYATFGEEPLYKDAYEQAAAIAESIIMNHPFVDGNKRTGFALMMAVLDGGGIWLDVPSAELYQFIVYLATGAKRFEEAVAWLRAHSTPASR